MHSTASIKAGLKELLQDTPMVLAAWEGGSAATGYLDEFSDLDLTIVIRDEDSEPLFQILEKYFNSLYGIERRFRLPEPTWHGMSQCFYLLKGCEPFFYCDIAVVPASNPNKFTEPDRHGNAVIWFDKADVYTAVNSSFAEQEKLIHRVLRASAATDFLGIIELQKALARGSWLSSQTNLQLFINRHLIPLLNIKYRPWKADFGIRYIDRDYPPEVYAKVEDLLHYNDVEDLRRNGNIALDMYKSLREELLIKYPDANPEGEKL